VSPPRLLCPVCGSTSRVRFRHYVAARNMVIKYRRCLNTECRRRFKTEHTAERLIGEPARSIQTKVLPARQTT
jgi:transcriptional regulator NrdR family protein